MNQIPHEKFEEADLMFGDGASVRKVSRVLGIARETAHRIQKSGRSYDLAVLKKTRVNTGKRADGSISFCYVTEWRPSW